jgi:hypothetical protein
LQDLLREKEALAQEKHAMEKQIADLERRKKEKLNSIDE